MLTECVRAYRSEARLSSTIASVPINWGHCGISLGDSKIIHAWDTVRIDDYREIEAMTALSGDRPRTIGWVPIERVLKQKP